MADPQSILALYLARTPGSAALAAEARRVLPGGIASDTRQFDPYGIYVTEAAGVRKKDVDGHDYLDFFGGHGANMLGHGHPAIVGAIGDAAAKGLQFAANHPLEVRLAQRVLALLPKAERLRFTGSGTEATLLAIRLARAFTGRRKILRFASHYHGWHDHAASGYAGQFDGGAAPGVLPEIAAQTILLRPSDREGLAAAFDRHGRDIAALIVEPVGTHFGVVPTSAAFLQEAQDAARAAGSLFILDEVLSGFRVDLGGAQAVMGLEPDLTTLAKVLCGGLPGGAVAGRAAIMDLIDPDPSRRGGRDKVLHQGTTTANPVSMAAGLAMLEELERIDGCGRASALGALARRELAAACAAEGLPLRWYGEFSAFHLLMPGTAAPEAGDDLSALPMEAFLARPHPLLNRFRMALNILGFDVNSKCSGLLSAVHDEADVRRLASGVAEAGWMVRREGLL